MKVLVTGASGMVGRNLVDYFTQHGVDVIPTDLNGFPISGDLLDNDFVFTKLASLDFDAVVHLAAITEIKKTIENPKLCFEVNCFGTLNMLELAAKKNVLRFVLACHDTLTRVFTTDGLKRYTELNVGDMVFTINPSTGQIETKPIERIHVYPHDGQMIHFSGKRLDLLVTPNHEMLISIPARNKGHKVWKTVFEEAESAAARSVSRLPVGHWQGEETSATAVFSQHSLNPEDLFYIVGIFIGDGGLNGRQFQEAASGLSRAKIIETRDGNGRFVQHALHPQRREYFYPRIFLYIPENDKCRPHLKEVLNRNSFEYSEYGKSLYLRSRFLYDLFEQCYDARSFRKNPHSKRIPRWMLAAPPKLLRALLQGLLDSDGHRGVMLSTVSPYLVEDVMELCAKLGYFTSCSLDHNVSTIEGRRVESTSFRLNISSRWKSPMIVRAYKTARFESYKGNVFCVEVENHNFLVERNGRIAFSGNSSANIFGAPKKNPVKEDSPLDPRVPYDYSKVISENMVMSFHKSKELPVSITRSWLLFGEYDQPTRATNRFIRACLKNEPMTLYGGGKDTTTPTHAANYAKLALMILKDDRAVGNTFNFGGEKVVSIRQLAETIKKFTGSSSTLNIAPPRSEQEKEPQISYPSTERARRVLGYAHELTLEEGLKRTIDWVKKTG